MWANFPHIKNESAHGPFDPRRNLVFTSSDLVGNIALYLRVNNVSDAVITRETGYGYFFEITITDDDGTETKMELRIDFPRGKIPKMRELQKPDSEIEDQEQPHPKSQQKQRQRTEVIPSTAPSKTKRQSKIDTSRRRS